ncbi:hypothetical protein N2152v2_001802 [Parachlorella kessleri]
MSNPFAPRPELRTASGTAIAKKRTPGSGLAGSSPQLTTSADGEYYDLELTPGVTSKPTDLDVEGSHWDAESWLLSPDLEMDGIQASWDSVSRLNILEGNQQPEPSSSRGSMHETVSKLSSLATPGSVSSSKARAWLREHAKTPGRAALPSTDDAEVPAEEAWKIGTQPSATPAAQGIAAAAADGPDEAAEAELPPIAATEAVDTTPRRQPAPPALAVPSPAHDYPRSFPVMQEQALSGLPSATSSLGYWLRDGEEEGSLSPGSSSGGEVSPAQAGAVSPVAAAAPSAAEGAAAAGIKGDGVQQEGIRRLQAEFWQEPKYAILVSSPPTASAAFASPISLADSAVLVTPTSAPRNPAPTAYSLPVAEASAPEPLVATATGAAAAAAEAKAVEAEPVPEAFPAQPVPASAQLPRHPAVQRRLRGVVTPLLCLLATIGAVAAALLLMPAGFSLVAPTAPSSGAAIFPQGVALPVLPEQLLQWPPAWTSPAQTAPTIPAAVHQSLPRQQPPSPPQQAQPATPASTAKAGTVVGKAPLLIPPGASAEYLRRHVPLPKSWAKPPPPQAAVLGTTYLSRQAAAAAQPAVAASPANSAAAAATHAPSQPAPAATPTTTSAQSVSTTPPISMIQPGVTAPPHTITHPVPAAPLASHQPQLAAGHPTGQPASKLVPPVDKPAVPAGLTTARAQQTTAQPASSPAARLAVIVSAAVLKATPAFPVYNLHAARAQLGAWTARLQHRAEASLAWQQLQTLLNSPPIRDFLPSNSSPAALAAIAAVTVTAALFGGAVAAHTSRRSRQARRDSDAAADGSVEPAGQAVAEEQEYEDGHGPEDDNRPGVKSVLFSHMKLQRPPATTPAVGGRTRRRQSNVAVIEADDDYPDTGLPSVAPHKLGTATRSRARRHNNPETAPTPGTTKATRGTGATAAVLGDLIEGEVAPSMSTVSVRRSRRLALH